MSIHADGNDPGIKRILGIDSSAVSASCAVITDGGRLVSQSFVNVGLTHSETLLTLISGTLDEADMSLADIDYLAVSSGPGSFTGIRIGVSTVKGIAFTDQKPCAGVSTLEAICFGMSGALRGTPKNGANNGNYSTWNNPAEPGAVRSLDICCPVMDARREQVYNALFAYDEGSGYPRRLCPDRAISIEELAIELEREYGENTVWMCGDGAELVWSRLSHRLPGLRLAPVQLRYQTGYGVAAAALRMINEGKAVTPDRLVPTYLRPSQAERELAEKLSGKQSS